MGHAMAGHWHRPGTGHGLQPHGAKAEALAPSLPAAGMPPRRRRRRPGPTSSSAAWATTTTCAVVLGESGALAGMAGRHLRRPHHRLGRRGARARRRRRARGLHFIDAPVSGGRPARNGVLTVMCGGDAAASIG
jgi:3-hydroxyisobutyrate dehydrogenase-like beta-hydroxyacid dehydrogenase